MCWSLHISLWHPPWYHRDLPMCWSLHISLWHPPWYHRERWMSQAYVQWSAHWEITMISRWMSQAYVQWSAHWEITMISRWMSQAYVQWSAHWEITMISRWMSQACVQWSAHWEITMISLPMYWSLHTSLWHPLTVRAVKPLGTSRWYVTTKAKEGAWVQIDIKIRSKDGFIYGTTKSEAVRVKGAEGEVLPESSHTRVESLCVI